MITLQGHSAGATSVCHHLVTPGSRNFFQRAIIESGGCDTLARSLEQGEAIGDEISAHFCKSSTDTVTCLQSLDAATLLEYANSKHYTDFYVQTPCMRSLMV